MEFFAPFSDFLYIYLANITIGKVAAIVELLFFLPYFSSILLKKTRPHRVSWWIITVVAFVIAYSNDTVAVNPDTRWFAWALFVGPCVVALISIPYGVGGWNVKNKKESNDQIISIVGAVIGILFLVFLEHPFLALLAGLTADYFGIRLTIKKARDEPDSESRLAWTITFIASVLAVFAIDTLPSWPLTFDFLAVAIFPLYMLFVNGAIAFWLYFSPHRHHA